MFWQPGKLYIPKDAAPRKWVIGHQYGSKNKHLFIQRDLKIDLVLPQILFYVKSDFKKNHITMSIDLDRPYHIFIFNGAEIELHNHYKQFRKDWVLAE